MPRRTRLAVIAAALAIAGPQSSTFPPMPSGYLGSYVWTMARPSFGGLSALELSDDGQTFVALTDKGRFLEGTLNRDADGRIRSVTAGQIRALLASRTAPLAEGQTDSEGLAIAKDGTAYVSFEGPARVLRYDRLDGPPTSLPRPTVFLNWHRNAGFEALAIRDDGALFAIPEDVTDNLSLNPVTGLAVPKVGQDFPVWRFLDGQWSQPFDLPRDGRFLPVAADFGPDGRLYVLERNFYGLIGFASRVRSFQIEAGLATDMRLHLQSLPGQHDNLEGMAVWRDAEGRLRLTLISDDNFLPVQHTEIVDYRLPG